jgi:predicted RNA binding protein YcfA (HicA-like mRNA interferase family)
MRLPRDLSGRDLAKALAKLGYEITRQTSSHIRLTTTQNGEHHVTIPDHDSIRVGTLAGILGDVARHHDLTRDRLAQFIFGRK